jgi:hypothetical protein
MRAYSMRGVMGAADRAVALTVELLKAQHPGSLVHDVQDDPRFRHRGVDLLWDRPGQPVVGVEVKGDRQGGRRGTYFFELLSNAERESPGCFLYSEADLMAYVFLDRQEVHLLQLKAVREWFLPRAKAYPLKTTKTKTGAALYTTVGAVVPVREARAGAGEAITTFPRPESGTASTDAAPTPRPRRPARRGDRRDRRHTHMPARSPRRCSRRWPRCSCWPPLR